MKINKKSNQGITLIALIITIIVLLLLAVVSIKLVVNSGIIEHSKNATIVQELTYVEEQVKLRIEEEKLNKVENKEEFNISDYTSLESFNPPIESKYSEYIRIENGEIYIITTAPEEIKKAGGTIGVAVKERLSNIRIYGNSIQDGTPTPENPVEIQSVGELITDTNDSNYGKYKIPVKTSGKNFNIYLDEPLRKVGDIADYIDFASGKVVRNIYGGNFDGSEDEPWIKSSIVENTFFTASGSGPKAKYRSHIMFCNRYCFKKNIESELIDKGCIAGGGNFGSTSAYFAIKDTNYTTLVEWQNYIQDNNLEVQYQLATPTEEKIDLPSISELRNMKNISVETTIQPSEITVME